MNLSVALEEINYLTIGHVNAECCFYLQTTSVANQAEKRQRGFDKVIDEWKRKVADLQVELERSQKESRATAAEVYKLRAQLEESTDAIEAVRRENKNLSGDFRRN